jgi:L-lactate dehydrogenase complex protein LldF
MEPRADRFHEAAASALAQPALQQALAQATERFVQMRLAARAERPDWEELRARGRSIRWEAIGRLDQLLVQLEERVRANGGQVFWASDAADACRYVCDLATRHGVTLAVKSKSMATEEIGLNAALQQAGVTAVETDLGEFIIQLAGETPSHFLAPAIHWTRGQVGDLFERALGETRDDDPAALTRQARRALRRRFLDATLGITGANFAVAETGTVVILENEGNARLTTSLPRVHVAVMGVEKVIPRLGDLETLLPLLVRSATGQRLSSYVSLLNGPRRNGEEDGPDEFHLVLLDNGRSRILADPEARESLLCIRCAACLAACPVYRRAGGHAYGWVYQGPIGSVLTPQLIGAHRAAALPFASSLCGACRDACPVKIDIPRLLLHLRAHVVERVLGRASGTRRAGARLAAWVMASPVRFRWAGRLAYWTQRFLGRRGLAFLVKPVRAWSRAREVPPLPRRALRDLVRRHES